MGKLRIENLRLAAVAVAQPLLKTNCSKYIKANPVRRMEGSHNKIKPRERIDYVVSTISPGSGGEMRTYKF